MQFRFEAGKLLFLKLISFQHGFSKCFHWKLLLLRLTVKAFKWRSNDSSSTCFFRKHWDGWCFRNQFSPKAITWQVITTQVSVTGRSKQLFSVSSSFFLCIWFRYLFWDVSLFGPVRKRQTVPLVTYMQALTAGLQKRSDTSTRGSLPTGRTSLWCRNWYAY